MCGGSYSRSSYLDRDNGNTATAPAKRATWTPVQMLAAVFQAFSSNRKGPSIDLETGKPTYLTHDKFTEGSGCAITTVARINPAMHAQIVKIRFHDDANVQGLIDQGIDVRELLKLDGVDGGHVASYSTAEFLQDLQNVHDRSARIYWRAYKDNDDDALQQFRDAFVNRVRRMAARWNLPLNRIGEEYLTMNGKKNAQYRALISQD